MPNGTYALPRKVVDQFLNGAWKDWDKVFDPTPPATTAENIKNTTTARFLKEGEKAIAGNPLNALNPASKGCILYMIPVAAVGTLTDMGCAAVCGGVEDARRSIASSLRSADNGVEQALFSLGYLITYAPEAVLFYAEGAVAAEMSGLVFARYSSKGEAFSLVSGTETPVFGMAAGRASTIAMGPNTLPGLAGRYIRRGAKVDDAVALMTDAAASQGLRIGDFADDIIVNAQKGVPSFVWRENSRIVVVISEDAIKNRRGAGRLLEGLHELGHLQDVKTLGFDLYYDIAFRRGKLAAIERHVESRAFRQLEQCLADKGLRVPPATRSFHERFLNAWR